MHSPLSNLYFHCSWYFLCVSQSCLIFGVSSRAHLPLTTIYLEVMYLPSPPTLLTRWETWVEGSLWPRSPPWTPRALLLRNFLHAIFYFAFSPLLCVFLSFFLYILLSILLLFVFLSFFLFILLSVLLLCLFFFLSFYFAFCRSSVCLFSFQSFCYVSFFAFCPPSVSLSFFFFFAFYPSCVAVKYG